MIITIFFIILSIALAIVLPIYLKKKNKMYSFKPSTKNGLKENKKDIRKIWGIDDIKDGIISINGKNSIIIELGSIEYKLLNDEEQNNIDNNLIKLAKTFSKQIQFFSTTEKIDTSDKIELINNNIQLQKNENIKDYGNSIIEYLSNIMQENNLYVRKNYCIIDSNEPIEKAKIELEDYYNDFKYSLASIKIKTRRLSDMEIIELIGRELNKQPNESIRKMIQKGGLDLYVQAEDRA